MVPIRRHGKRELPTKKRAAIKRRCFCVSGCASGAVTATQHSYWPVSISFSIALLFQMRFCIRTIPVLLSTLVTFHVPNLLGLRCHHFFKIKSAHTQRIFKAFPTLILPRIAKEIRFFYRSTATSFCLSLPSTCSITSGDIFDRKKNKYMHLVCRIRMRIVPSTCSR